MLKSHFVSWLYCNFLIDIDNYKFFYMPRQQRAITRRQSSCGKHPCINNQTSLNQTNRRQIWMTEEYEGAGLIILDWMDNQIKVLLVKGIVGKWGFPKGKREPEEVDSRITAIRETEEETGLKEEHYTLHDTKIKAADVVFRYASIKPEFRLEPRIIRPHEIINVGWKSFSELPLMADTNYSLRLYLSQLEEHSWWLKSIMRFAKFNIHK